MDSQEKKYLELLAKSFPNSIAAATEIINLTAILNLPKGTEFFVSDLHGEYEAFSHTMRNAAGTTRLKIDDVFGDAVSEQEKRELATIVYYPSEKTAQVLELLSDSQKPKWLADKLIQIVLLARKFSQKYSRSRIRKALPQEYAYIMEELMSENGDREDDNAYMHSIIDSAIKTNQAKDLIVAFSRLIKRLAIDRLHVVGDIYDRGPYPHTIMDDLEKYHSLDIQWGNHDVVWMGAALGQRGCIAHVVRNCARYGNLSILEDAYGINLLPLAQFAARTYGDECSIAFGLKGNPDLSAYEYTMNEKIQKAMAILQFKIEGHLIDEYPEFDLDDRKLLHKIDHKSGTVEVDGTIYELKDTNFPTIDKEDPYKLTDEEENVMERLVRAFKGSEKLQRHMRLFLDKGSLYKVYNDTLMLHACVPLNEDGNFLEVNIFGKKYKGKALFDVIEKYVRASYLSDDPHEQKLGTDLLWYLWLGPGSPLFAKSKMATFELHLIEDKEARREVKNTFYSCLEDNSTFDMIFAEFGLNPSNAHMVCGHVPVKVKDGEDPIKCGGRLFTIDGGFSKAYQPTTGIAGYTLISNSHGYLLATHHSFESKEAAISECVDLHSTRRSVKEASTRKLISQTDIGADIQKQIDDLNNLLSAYERGEIIQS